MQKIIGGVLNKISLAFSKPYLKKVIFGVVLIIGTSSCASIIGGGYYNADIRVANRPTAKIYHQGNYVGTGNAMLRVKRRDANKLVIGLKEDGCPDQVFTYHTRTVRAWALVGTILVWTGQVGNIPIFFGVAVDLITGAFWKPNVNENGITKLDYKNYRYSLKYDQCNEEPAEKKELLDFVYLKNGSIIKGTILEHVINVKVKIKTRDGSIFVYPSNEIEKLTREVAEPVGL